MSKITSWGMYPVVDAQEFTPTSKTLLQNIIHECRYLTPRGNGRSYGDSALGATVVTSKYMDCLVNFDKEKHTIKVQSGVRLDTLLEVLIPQGYFLPVVPGTKYITIGGAVASDIHGKNHHREGTFSEHIKNISVIGADGTKVQCSNEINKDLFQATCGGMGLTGYIDEVEFSLKKIQSNKIAQVAHQAKNVDELFDLFELYKDFTYSVAWIDCLSSGEKLGRGILMVGEHDTMTGDLKYQDLQIPIPVPMMPTWTLNVHSIKAFNLLFFHKNLSKITKNRISLDAFFFPLDKLKKWNRLYGKNGLTQYQCVVPNFDGRANIKKILLKIAQYQGASFLAVLKQFGPQNGNCLSFPLEGYTLSLDFKITSELIPFLQELNEMVIEFGGRVYLTKDMCLSQEHFLKMYSNGIEKFQEVRKKYGALKFQSLQSERLGI